MSFTDDVAAPPHSSECRPDQAPTGGVSAAKMLLTCRIRHCRNLQQLPQGARQVRVYAICPGNPYLFYALPRSMGTNPIPVGDVRGYEGSECGVSFTDDVAAPPHSSECRPDQAPTGGVSAAKMLLTCRIRHCRNLQQLPQGARQVPGYAICPGTFQLLDACHDAWVQPNTCGRRPRLRGQRRGCHSPMMSLPHRIREHARSRRCVSRKNVVDLPRTSTMEGQPGMSLEPLTRAPPRHAR